MNEVNLSKKRQEAAAFDLLSVVGCAVALFASVAVFSNARFWWHMPIGAAAPWWFPLLLVASFFQFRRLVQGRAPKFLSLLMVGTVVLSTYQFAQPFLILTRPPIRASIPGSGDTYFSLAVLDEKTVGNHPQREVTEYLEKFKHDVAIVFGANSAALPFHRFPFQRDFNSDGVHFTVGSRFEWLEDSIFDFGDEALPAAAMHFEMSNGRRYWLAVLSLWESGDPYSFHINRLSLRRVSTLFRNTDEPGVLVADLKIPIFARYYGLLTKYGFLRNIWQGRLFDSQDPLLFFKLPFTGRHILVNRGMTVKDLSLLSVGDDTGQLQSSVELGVRSRVKP